MVNMVTFFLSYELVPLVLNMTVTASVVILAVLLARVLLRGAPKVFSYALWGVVLFRLLCPFSLTSGVSLLALVDPPVRTLSPQTSAVEYVPQNIVHTEFPQVQLPIPGVSEAINDRLPQGEEQLVADPLEGPVAEAAQVYLMGALAMGGYGVISFVRLRRRLVGAVLLRENIYLADHIGSPFVMGLFRPRIYLPSALSQGEQGYIILHEQCHIRRLDHVAKALAFTALCVHWFNPLVWLAFVLAGQDMEMSCDEAVVKQLGEDIRGDYSASLLSLATGRPILAGTPLAFGEGDTGARIRNLLAWKRPKPWMVLTAAALCLGVAVLCALNPKTAPPPIDHPAQEPQWLEVAEVEDFLWDIQEGDPLTTIRLERDGEAVGHYEDCWEQSNAAYYWQRLPNLPWEAAEPPAAPPAGDAVTLFELNGWSLTAWKNSPAVHFQGPTGEAWLICRQEEDAPYLMLREWFDEAEYSALGGAHDQQSIVIPDRGQDYLAAAAEYVEAFEGLHLRATSGSKYCYTFVQTQVEGAEEVTQRFRELGEIDENTYAFYLVTLFVPENQQALDWSIAGNTEPYSGSDPNVPQGAFGYRRCGYMTLEEDGWHGKLVGTGW